MKKIIYILLFLFLLCSNARALDVIPDLKVFGGDTRAAYGNDTNPTIYVVDSLTPNDALADETRNGVNVKTGGLDTILEAAGNNKLIIFEVSGNIDGGSYSPCYVTEDYITIAGQTAPSPGITLKNYQILFSGHDVVVQHVRARMTDSTTGTTYDYRRAMEVSNYTTQYPYNVIIDHCSFSWGMDQVFDIYAGQQSGIHDVTLSNSIVAEGLKGSRHSTGDHSTNLLVDAGVNIGIINNLMMSSDYRSPYIGNGHVNASILVANNFIYNAGILGFSLEERTYIDDFIFEGNVIEGGPDSGTYASDRVLGWVDDLNDNTEIYLVDNKCDDGAGTATQSSANDWITSHSFVRDASGEQDIEATTKVLSAPFSYPSGYTPMASASVKTYVLANVGARSDDRDTVDTRLVSDATNNTGDIIDTILYTNADCTGSGTPFACCTGSGAGTCDQCDEGGFPALAANTDTHNDLPSSPHADSGDGYTNLEKWLHSFSAAVKGDTFTISGAGPSGEQTCTSDPRNVTMSWTTDRYCNCRIKGVDEGDYDFMPADSVTNTDSTSHSDVESLACGASYDRYVYCEDSYGNEVGPTTISFSIASGVPPDPPPGTVGTISGGGCSGGSM